MNQPITLFPGITLRCFPDHRFKHGCLSIQFLRPMCREEAAMNALLPAVLLRGCRGYENLRTITLHLDDLYGASIGALVRRIGDVQTTGLYCSFMEDRFAMAGDAILAPVVDFARRLLLEPLTEENAFPKDFVESEKKNLIDTIEAQLNDKRAYAMDQLLQHMCREDSYGIPRLGTAEQVAAITPESLFEHYKTVLSTSEVQLCYVGSAQPETVAELLKEAFRSLPHNPQALPPQTAFRSCEKSNHVQELDVNQAKLCMGFTTGTTLRDPDFAAMQVLNALFGSGMTSKLFMQIREKLSLCYAIGSNYYGSKGILTVSAGIDADQAQRVKEEILAQLDNCRNGQISDEELRAAKQYMRSGLLSIPDSPGSIENYYATAAISGMQLTPEAYMEAVEQVSIQQVSRLAQQVQLHTVYLLKGVAT